MDGGMTHVAARWFIACAFKVWVEAFTILLLKGCSLFKGVINELSCTKCVCLKNAEYYGTETPADTFLHLRRLNLTRPLIRQNLIFNLLWKREGSTTIVIGNTLQSCLAFWHPMTGSLRLFWNKSRGYNNMFAFCSSIHKDLYIDMCYYK